MILSVTFLFFFLSYYSKSNLYLSPIDPLKILAIKDAIVVYTILTLYYSHTIGSDILFIAFCYLLIGFVLTFIVSTIYGDKYKGIVKNICLYFCQTQNSKKSLLFIIFVLGIGLHACIIFYSGNSGESRLNSSVILRFFELVWLPTISFYILDIICKTTKKNIHKKLLLLLFVIFCLLTVSGKGAFLAIVLSLSLAHAIGVIKINIFVTIIIILTSIIFIFLSLRFSYGIKDFNLFWDLLRIRILMDADIYIIAFQQNLTSTLELNGLFSYIFGPVVKLLGWGHLVAENIGAQVGSASAGFAVKTGPQAQIPFLIYLAGYKGLIMIPLISLILNIYALILKFGLMFFAGRFLGSSLIVFPLVQFSLVGLAGFTSDPAGHSLYLIEAVVFCLLLVSLFTIIRKNRTT